MVLRVVLCLEIGAPVDWTPKLNLGFVVLPFRSDTLPTTVLHTLLSTLRLGAILYFWLLVLVSVNRRSNDPDAIGKLLRFQLGRLAQWPAAAQLCFPVLTTAVLWMVVQPALAHYRIATRADSWAHLAGQGLVISIGLVLSLKYLLAALLLGHLVLSYVYLGNNPVWDFVTLTSRNLLAPLHRAPLRFAKVDLVPFGGILLIFLLLVWAPNALVAKLAQHNLMIWPR